MYGVSAASGVVKRSLFVLELRGSSISTEIAAFLTTEYCPILSLLTPDFFKLFVYSANDPALGSRKALNSMEHLNNLMPIPFKCDNFLPDRDDFLNDKIWTSCLFLLIWSDDDDRVFGRRILQGGSCRQLLEIDSHFPNVESI